ncbi:MAG: polysaccharide biosynthesis/export family protein [Gammaproteobacteria bacterium]
MKPSLFTIISMLVMVSMTHLVVAAEMGQVDHADHAAPVTLNPDQRAEPPPIYLDVVAEESEEETAAADDAAAAAAAAAADDADELAALPEELYRIEPGDVLAIEIWKEDDLDRQAMVLPDGTFSYPLIGYMTAAGETLPAIRDKVTARLAKYFADPVVTVSLLQLSGNQIFVIGNAARPGVFIATRNLDIMQLLSLAGGMTPFAAVNKIKIIRRVDGVQTIIPFRYRDVEKGVKLEQNIILKGGDIVVVP